jgi:hypothetical protein
MNLLSESRPQYTLLRSGAQTRSRAAAPIGPAATHGVRCMNHSPPVGVDTQARSKFRRICPPHTAAVPERG